MLVLVRGGAAGRTYKVPHFAPQFQESGSVMVRVRILRSPVLEHTQCEGFTTSDHGGHDLADAPLELGVVGYWTAYRDFARKVRMNAAADQLRGVDQ